MPDLTWDGFDDGEWIEYDFHTFAPGGQRDAVEEITSAYGTRRADLYSNSWDAFTAGTPLDFEKAKWFMGLYVLAGGDDYKGHLRDMHYNVNAQRPDLYDGSDASFAKLMDAKALAVTLGLVRPDALDDRSIARAFDADRFPVGVSVPEGFHEPFALPEAVVFSTPRSTLVSPAVACPIDLMLWVEKPSPMIEDEVWPVSKKFGADVRFGRGAPGQTFVGHLARRAAERGREFVLVVLSDADFSGATMPRSLSKNLEVIFRGGLVEDVPRLRVVRVDFTMDRVAVIEAELGRTIPRTVDGKTGDERIELQALPAFVPGELGRLVEEAFVSVVGDGFLEAARQWEADLDGVLADSDEAAGLKELAVELEELLDSPEFRVIRERLEFLEERRAEAIMGLHRIVDDAEPPQIVEPPTDWLLDTDRSYLHQVQAYRRHEGLAPLEFVPRPPCLVCGGPVTGDVKKVYCSRACRKKAGR